MMFLDYLKVEKRHSGHTITAYGSDMGQFSGFLINASKADRPNTGTDELLRSADTELVRKFLAFLNEKQYSKASIARKLITLSSFYKFLLKTSRIDSNPLATIEKPRQERKELQVMTHEQVNRLLETPNRNKWLGARDRAILETLYSTGMKVSELVALTLDDIDFSGETVHIRGIRGKGRTVPISSSALQTIAHYTELRNKRAQSDSGFDPGVLFLNKHGQRLNTRSVRRKLDKYLKMAGLDPAISPHTLRHSFAMHMLKHGADLGSVREMLGHQSLATTKGLYAQPANA